MKLNRSYLSLAISIIVALSFVLAGCQAAPTATPTTAPTATSVPQLAQPTPTARAATPPPVVAAATPTQAPPTPTPKPKAEGKVVIVTGEEPDSLEHHMAYSYVGFLPLRNIQEALLNRDSKTNELIGELATKWEQVKPDTWRFTLRSGVKFHNGEAVDADTAAYMTNRTWSKDNNFFIRQFIGPEISAKVVDASTVDITTASPDPILPLRVYFAPFAAMKHAKENPEELATKPIGTGPYKFVEWSRGQYIRLTANEDYWGGVPKIKDVVFNFRKESAVRSATVMAGEADLARSVNPDDCKKAPKCISAPTVETLFVRIDTPHIALRDLRVRQALAYAIDKEGIIKTILSGEGTLAAQIVGPFVNGHNPDLKPYPYDVAKSKALLAEAKAAGIKVESPLSVNIRGGYFARVQEGAEAVSNMLNVVGFKTTIKAWDTASHRTYYRQQPIPEDRGALFFHLHGNEMGDASASVTSYFRKDSTLAAYWTPKTEEMDNKARSLVGPERTNAYQEIMKVLYDDVAIVPISHLGTSYALGKRLEWTPRLDAFVLVKDMTLK